jgi:hypothetical protein
MLSTPNLCTKKMFKDIRNAHSKKNKKIKRKGKQRPYRRDEPLTTSSTLTTTEDNT